MREVKKLTKQDVLEIMREGVPFITGIPLQTFAEWQSVCLKVVEVEKESLKTENESLKTENEFLRSEAESMKSKLLEVYHHLKQETKTGPKKK